MEILFENPGRKPKVSLVLLDWTVRESFHMLDYLGEQTVPRSDYEVIWIEYYGRRAEEIDAMIKKAAEEGVPSPVDVWLVMDMPRNLYYHKHLMYNLGVVMGRGDIVCFCDSDAAVRPTFVESIIKSFEADRNIVLHLDELRSYDRRFCPFNYPPIDEIERTAENLRGGKPEGLTDRVDPLHSLNYGACMCALRDDLIAVGGSDEHMDYIGHVCGPYEMTFRLVNAGKREVWHQSEWLSHTWHPGQAGGGNYLGPHDGIHMSTTARDARKTGRTRPLRENPAIRKLRTGREVTDISEALDEEEMKKWTRGITEDRRAKLKGLWLSKNPLYGPSGKKPPRLGILTSIRLYKILLRMIIKQTYIKVKVQLAVKSTIASPEVQPGEKEERRAPGPMKIIKSICGKFLNLWGFIVRMWAHDRFMAGECWDALDKLSSGGTRDVVVFGIGDIAEMLYVLSGKLPVKISGFYDDVRRERFCGMDVRPVEDLGTYAGKVIIASFVNLEDRQATLRRDGVRAENIHVFK